MEQTVRRITGGTTRKRRAASHLRMGLFFLAGLLPLGGCYVVPAGYPVAGPAYVAPAPVIVAPRPMYYAPGPVYGWGGHRWRPYGRW